MFCIEYNCEIYENFCIPSATFIYKGTEVEFQMSISNESLFEPAVSDWLDLLDHNKCLNFGDRYGSHVDNGVVAIINKNDYLEFTVDGARGGVVEIKIPVAVCREFAKFAKLLKRKFLHLSNEKVNVD